MPSPATPAHRPSDPAPFRCATCLATIRHRPTFHVGLAFCCAGCVADGPCICSYDLDEDPPADLADAAVVKDPSRPLVGAGR